MKNKGRPLSFGWKDKDEFLLQELEFEQVDPFLEDLLQKAIKTKDDKYDHIQIDSLELEDIE